MALLFVPTTEAHGSHLIVIAQEQAGGVFESLGSAYRLDSLDVKLIGDTFRALGRDLRKKAFREALLDNLMNGGLDGDI